MPELKKILVPTDFSENASAAYKFAKKTAESYGAKVDFIHIIPKLHYFNVSLDALSHTFEDGKAYQELKEKATAKLEAEMQKHLAAENRGEAIAKIENRPYSGIADHAKNGNYDMILMAARGRHESEFLRGSVTEKVIRFSNVPVLTINKAYNPEIKTIVVPTDASRTSLEAMPMALLIAAHRQAKIQLLCISEYDGTMIKVEGERSYKYTDDELKQYVFDALKDYVGENSNKLAFGASSENPDSSIELKIDDEKIVEIEVVIKKGGSAHHSIVEYAKENAQLVVMGTHGRSGFANLFLGSTAEKVVRHLKMPVMAVKPEFIRKGKKQKEN